MFSLVSHPLVAAIILIAILIFVHEFGHFIVGRLCGIGVEVFSIGFGPEIISFKYNKVTYKLCWIPLGGYVKFYGAYPGEEVNEDDINGIKFIDSKAWKKMLTVSAGPVGNFLFAMLAYGILAGYGVPYQEAIIGEVRSGSVAHVVGLEPDDKIVEVNGKVIENWDSLRKIIALSANQKLDIRIERQGKTLDLEVVPEEVETKDIFGKTIKEGKFGISIARSDASFYLKNKDNSVGPRLIKVLAVEHKEGSYQEINFSNDLYKYLDALLAAPHGNSLSLKLKIKDAWDKESIEEFSFDIGSSGVKHGRDLCEQNGFNEALLVVGNSSVEKEEEEELKKQTGKDSESSSDFLSEVQDQNKLKLGDLILKWNGLLIRDIYDLSQVQMDYREPSADIEIVRDGKVQTVKVSLLPREVQLPSGKTTLYVLPNTMFGGLKTPETKYLKYSFIGSIGYGVRETLVQTKELTITLFKLVTGNIPLQALGGPMMIAKVASDSVKAGLTVFLGTLAIISINLGVLNLFPIPILDGGQFVIYTIELIRRKRASQVVIDSYQKIGFIMVMALVILATYNDFSRFWTSMLKTLSQWGSKF